MVLFSDTMFFGNSFNVLYYFDARKPAFQRVKSIYVTYMSFTLYHVLYS